MATKNKKDQKLGKAKAIVKKINSDLIDASFKTIENTVKTGEKWQKLTSKLIKKAEPLTKKQKNMMVETAETIKGQLEESTERLKKLVGYNPEFVEKAKNKVKENPLVEKAEEMKDKLEKEIAANKLVQKAEKMSDKLKKNITSTIEDVKEKIDDYTEEAIAGQKIKKKVKKAAKKTTKKSTNKVVADPVVIEVPKSSETNDLKVIKGIGPVLEQSLNKAGITAFEQIAKMTIKDMTALLTSNGINAKIYDLSGWKIQAKLAVKGDMEAVKNWSRK